MVLAPDSIRAFLLKSPCKTSVSPKAQKKRSTRLIIASLAGSINWMKIGEYGFFSERMLHSARIIYTALSDKNSIPFYDRNAILFLETGFLKSIAIKKR